MKNINNDNHSLLLIDKSLNIINIYNQYFQKLDKEYIINNSDTKVINFIFKYFIKGKKSNYHILIRKNQKFNIINTSYEIKASNKLEQRKLIQKFLNIFIIYITDLSKYFGIEKSILDKKFFSLIKKVFIKNILSSLDMNIIFGYKLIQCLYPEGYNIKINNITLINNTIKNIKEFYFLIDFLLSFTKDQLDEKNKSEFVEMIELFFANFEKILLNNNINNIYILSKNDYVFKLIRLCKISKAISDIVNYFLIRIYCNKFNFDYIFKDLSDQFTLNTEENISNITNYFILKNSFIKSLFECEEKVDNENEFDINSSFVFNNNEKNGIICYLSNYASKKFPKKGFSFVISFCIMNNNQENKYNIFSFYDKEYKNFIKLFLEKNTLKFCYNLNELSLFFDIKTNQKYVFWMIFPNDKSCDIIAKLNNTNKNFKNINYPSFEYKEILLGHDKDVSTLKNYNNFEGLLGPFIFFDNCLIKNKNDNKMESQLSGLKGDYEFLFHMKNNRDLIFINKSLDLTLKRMDLNILDKFEFIISPKSLGFTHNLNSLNKDFICNYYNYEYTGKEFYKFKFVSENSILNNITYPIESTKSLVEFINNHGIIYLQLELYYLIGGLSYKINQFEKKNNDKTFSLDENEINSANENLISICSIFFFCIKSKYFKLCNSQEINNFFYTLNDIIFIYQKYLFKMKKNFLNIFINELQFLFRNELLIDKCEFIFIYENYDSKDENIFDLLFNKLIPIIEELDYSMHKDVIKYLFKKMLDFDKIYLSENISKEKKKKYSLLIQNLLIISLEVKDNDCFDLYLSKLKKNVEQLISYLDLLKEKNNIFNFLDDISQDDSNNNLDKHFDESEKNIILDINKIYNIILIYKYLKNLFVVVDVKSTNETLFIINNIKKSNLKEFFNDLVFFLIGEFDISLIKYQMPDIQSKNINKIIKGYYSELIKSLCIEFLDLIFVDKKNKELKHNFSIKENDLGKRIRDSFHLSKNKNIFNTFAFNDRRKAKSRSISEASFEDNILNNPENIKIDNSKEEIYNIFNDFQFLQDMKMSKYTFFSIYHLIIKKKIKNKEAIKIIRNIEKKDYINNIENDNILTEEEFLKNKHHIDLMNILMEKINNYENNYELVKLGLILYSNLIIGISQFYRDKNTEKKEKILEYFLDNNYNCFFNIVINSLNKLTKEISTEENSEINKSQMKKLYDSFSEIVKEKLIKIIDNTILEFKDPFYFSFLTKCFFFNYIDINFVIGMALFMVNKLKSVADEKLYEQELKINSLNDLDKTIIIEITNKNILLLLYKIFFSISKRNFLLNNAAFMSSIYYYLCFFLSNSKLLFMKILFPIEDTTEPKKKLIIELLYEIILEICIEYNKNPEKKYLQNFENLLLDILNIKNYSNHRANRVLIEANIEENTKRSPKSNHSFFYVLDKISFENRSLFKITKGFKINIESIKKIKERIFSKYKNEFNEKENCYCVCIIFMVKIMLSIINLIEIFEKKENNNENLSNRLSPTFNIICKDCYNLIQKYNSLNPLNSEGQYNNSSYLYFQNFMLKEYNNKKNYNIKNFEQTFPKDINNIILFSRIIYNDEGNIILYTTKNYNILLKTLVDSESKIYNNSEISTNFSEEQKISNTNKFGELKRLYYKKKYTKKKTFKKSIDIPKENIEKEISIKYVEKYNLKRDIIRIFFSFYFQKMLVYDKFFIIIKKLYKYIYSKEINDIDEFDDFLCPLRIKNYIPKYHYFQPFLKKDFHFFDSGLLGNSHRFLFSELTKKGLDILPTKFLFPDNKMKMISDYPNNNLALDYMKAYYCELITNVGSLFGKIYLLENGILYVSDYENDKRNNDNYLDYVLCTAKFDFLKINKKIFLPYNQIAEIFNRTFLFHWISHELFMKNGKSYFFNFFQEKYNQEILDFYKSKKLKNIITNPKEFFDKNDFIKKWKNNIINTYDFLLILNKFSSRSYNNLNQYIILPWIKFENKDRNFDIPMSLQTEESIIDFQNKCENFKTMNVEFKHTIHYSNSAYVFYYLTRINPHTNNMLKFQGNNFEVPERQFNSVEATIYICPKSNNNREAIPEIFELPEIYYNINYNDFGKSENSQREHNINLKPYSNNGIEFCNYFINEINNNPDISSNINKWIDFIFGLNQINVNSKDNNLRIFNDEFYAQNSKFVKLISELKDKKVDEKEIYKTIKNKIAAPLNFGICPDQILDDYIPKKIIQNNSENIDTINNINTKEIQNIKSIENNEYLKFINFYKNDKNIYILYESCFLYILSQKKKVNKYKLKREIKEKGLLYDDYVGKYIFCELKDDFYIFCGFLDKTLKFYHDKNEFKYLLNEYTTSIISLTENEFITGHHNGKLIKWELLTQANNNKMEYKLNKIMEIKSNNNAIKCIEYDKNLDILLICDNNSIIIRKYYNFEFLKYIRIKENNKAINKIIKIKIFNNNLIYALVQLKENNLYELQCYSLNGTFYKKIEGYFTDFKFTKSGNIIVNDLNQGKLIIYKGCIFEKIYEKSFSFVIKNEFLFEFENPNIIYICHNENNSTYIKKDIIDEMEEYYFK